MGLSIMHMLGLSSSAYFTHRILLKISSFSTTHKSSVSTAFTEQITPILRILCYNGSLVPWTVVCLTKANFKHLIFSMSGFTLSYISIMFIIMILYDFSLFPTQFCYIMVYIRKVKSCVQFADSCELWISSPKSKSNLCYDRRSFGQSVLE
jgi:hypothetical protein